MVLKITFEINQNVFAESESNTHWKASVVNRTKEGQLWPFSEQKKQGHTEQHICFGEDDDAKVNFGSSNYRKIVINTVNYVSSE